MGSSRVACCILASVLIASIGHVEATELSVALTQLLDESDNSTALGKSAAKQQYLSLQKQVA